GTRAGGERGAPRAGRPPPSRTPPRPRRRLVPRRPLTPAAAAPEPGRVSGLVRQFPSPVPNGAGDDRLVGSPAVRRAHARSRTWQSPGLPRSGGPISRAGTAEAPGGRRGLTPAEGPSGAVLPPEGPARAGKPEGRPRASGGLDRQNSLWKRRAQPWSDPGRRGPLTHVERWLSTPRSATSPFPTTCYPPWSSSPGWAPPRPSSTARAGTPTRRHVRRCWPWLPRRAATGSTGT